MVWLTIILGIVLIYYIVKFYLLKANINGAKKALDTIISKGSTNQKLTLSNPESSAEGLLDSINQLLLQKQTDRIGYLNQEKTFKKNVESISHDLRTPLTALYGYIELIKDEETTEGDRQKYIEIIERKAIGLENLIDSFYHFTRIETGDYQYEMSAIDINSLLQKQLLGFYQDFQQRQLKVRVDLDESACQVLGDINGLNRIYYNLIHNALKYSKSYVDIQLRKINDQVIINFANDTDQLNTGEIDLLFDRFYKMDEARHHNSSGLGLTITKMLVEKMNGSIEAVYDEEQLKFCILLPLYN